MPLSISDLPKSISQTIKHAFNEAKLGEGNFFVEEPIYVPELTGMPPDWYMEHINEPLDWGWSAFPLIYLEAYTPLTDFVDDAQSESPEALIQLLKSDEGDVDIGDWVDVFDVEGYEGLCLAWKLERTALWEYKFFLLGVFSEHQQLFDYLLATHKAIINSSSVIWNENVIWDAFKSLKI